MTLQSLLLAALLLLLFLLFDALNSPRNSETIVFLEVFVLVDVPPDQQIWVCLFKLIKESIVDDRNLVDVDEGKFLALSEKLLDSEVTHSFALCHLDVLQIDHILHKRRQRCITDGRP